MSFASYLPRLDTLVVDAPDVNGLRRLIMGLALSGHLDAPDANDAGFSTALGAASDDIQQEAADALRVSSLTCQFERFATVAEIKKGLTPIERASPGAYPLVVTADTRLSCDHFDFEGNAVLIPMVSSTGHGNASLKRLHYQEGQFAVGNILCAAFPRDQRRVSARFLYEYLTAFKDELLVSRMIGTANVSLTLDKIGQVPIPMIATSALSRLDELMGLCDQLERAHKEREVWRDRLRSAALHRLTSSDRHGTTSLTDARFFLDRTPRLITKSEHVAAIRQTVIDLAIRGRLLAQDPRDESTPQPSNHLQAQAGTPSHLPELTMPAGWRWSDLASNAWLENGDRSKNYPSKDHRVAVGVPFVNAGHLNDESISEPDLDFISEERFQLLRSGKFVRNDILFCLRGSLGKVARVSNLERGAIASSLIILRPRPSVDGRFLHLYLKSGFVTEQVRRFDNGTAQPNLAGKDLGRFGMPLPPLSEQRGIVAKVHELMALCDELEAALASAEDGRGRLLEALLYEVLDFARVPNVMQVG